MSDTKTKVHKSEAEWRKELTPMQFAVLREKATERPFTGEYEHEHRKGTYACAGCGHTIDCTFESLPLLPGLYRVDVRLQHAQSAALLASLPRSLAAFRVRTDLAEFFVGALRP